jgi:hypothetical protein
MLSSINVGIENHYNFELAMSLVVGSKQQVGWPRKHWYTEQSLRRLATLPAQAEFMSVIVKEKMATMKMEIMQEIGMKMEENTPKKLRIP